MLWGLQNKEFGKILLQTPSNNVQGRCQQAACLKTARNAIQATESKRELEIRTLEVKDDGDKSLTVFHTPRDVRGTALLTFSHGVDPDDQWLYLPALRRVKRIASNNQSGPFMGSEFGKTFPGRLLLQVNTADGANQVVYTAGSTVDSGDVQVDSLVPLSFTGLGSTGLLAVRNDSAGANDAEDTLVYRGVFDTSRIAE